jgi:hypothetical protein
VVSEYTGKAFIDFTKIIKRQERGDNKEDENF